MADTDPATTLHRRQVRDAYAHAIWAGDPDIAAVLLDEIERWERAAPETATP